jgi:hypothetical protein
MSKADADPVVSRFDQSSRTSVQDVTPSITSTTLSPFFLPLSSCSSLDFASRNHFKLAAPASAHGDKQLGRFVVFVLGKGA